MGIEPTKFIDVKINIVGKDGVKKDEKTLKVAQDATGEGCWIGTFYKDLTKVDDAKRYPTNYYFDGNEEFDLTEDEYQLLMKVANADGNAALSAEDKKLLHTPGFTIPGLSIERVECDDSYPCGCPDYRVSINADNENGDTPHLEIF